jgi:hypothetical protein
MARDRTPKPWPEQWHGQKQCGQLTLDLVEEIKDCIEGHKMLASVPIQQKPPLSKPPNRAPNGELSLEEVENWLNDVPLFE